MTNTSPNTILDTTLAVGEGGLTPGRGYRLHVTGPGTGDGDGPWGWLLVAASADSGAGDEHFPYPGENDIWRADLQAASGSACIEFRAPAAGTIEIEAIARENCAPESSGYAFSLEPLSPAISPGLLRRLEDIQSIAQERCKLIDLPPGKLKSLPLTRSDGPVAQATTDRWLPRIAFVGSHELATELSLEGRVTILGDADWQAALERGKFDFLLIEPVLHVGHAAWRYGMTRSGRSAEMARLLAHCRKLQLPVVLWLRVEPDLYAEFSWLAPLADKVYAVDRTILRMLEAQYPDLPAQLLPPAVQPRLHNPIRERSMARFGTDLCDKVLMDGWWLAAAQRDDALLCRLRAERLLLAESRWEFSFTRLATLPEYRWNTIGCLDLMEKAMLSRFVGAELFLADDTLGRWRQLQSMLRSAACGSIVLFRNEGCGSSMIDEALCRHGDDDAICAALADLVDAPVKAATWRHRVSRHILQHHSYQVRLEQIVSDLGIAQDPGKPPKVACLLVSMRPWLLESCIRRFQRDLYPEKELIIVIHGEPGSARELAALEQRDPRIRIHQLGRARSLGECLNYAAAQTNAPFWAKIDDDDFYGPSYLSDMMLYQQLADFDLLAKPSAFVYQEGSDELRWHTMRGDRGWMRYPAGGSEPTVGIAGGSLLGRRSLLRSVPFSESRRGGSDSDFVLRARAAGHDLLVTDPFNFAFFRSARAGFHTWDTDAGQLARDTVALGTGDRLPPTVFI